MTDEKGAISVIEGKAVCLYCHDVQPDPSRDRTRDVSFTADVGFLCWRCHPPMPGSFFDKHFLVKPESWMLKTIEATERQEGVILPLVPKGRITCSTCHNPHQKGVIQRKEAAAGADAHARLRIDYNSLCRACHWSI